ncbi:MAG: sigma-70 family RNA polymerase sigma factor [Acidipropionibacterium jensenii]|uniref:sigma-70 family RNA polymerase sigma factor n=1 Tax=Acidipropionibacterium jensenii TaxID=1749 RepID=UPI00264914F8|nr:sigma-70 family RNA polymerase sigma factor [Acidipropionibacterium jensenii]MDN5977711.1 sigma-70 family RNA polymerase sigma factor [Acidipropionibacterium jensenii]
METDAVGDAELLARISTGDESALRELIERHSGWLMLRLRRRAGNADLAATALQDAFVVVWQQAGRYRGDGDVGAWLWGMAIRRLIPCLRTRPAPVALRDEVVARYAGQTLSAEEQLLLAVEHGDLGDAMARLSPDLRAALRATVLDGLTTREAALLLGVPHGTVKSRVRLAKIHLRRHLMGGSDMTSRDTHLTADLWQRYAAGGLDPTTESAVEAHLLSCPSCRRDARTVAGDPQPLWQAVHARIDHPRRSLPMRLLTRLGVRDSDVAVIAASDDLQLPWAIAVSGAIACAIAAALSGVSYLPVFLALAPLVPVIAVSAAFDATDPLRELVGTTACPRLRITLLRTLSTLVVALPAVLVLGSMVPGLNSAIWLWLLPGLLLTSATLVLLNWLPARTAAAISSIGWLLVVASMAGLQASDLLGQLPVQGLSALLTVLLGVALRVLSDRSPAIGVSP